MSTDYRKKRKNDHSPDLPSTSLSHLQLSQDSNSPKKSKVLHIFSNKENSSGMFLSQGRTQHSSESQILPKVTFKGFKVKPSLPNDYEQKVFNKLRQAILAIQQGIKLSCSKEELYNDCLNLCNQQLGGKLYAQLLEECERHISGVIQLLDKNSNEGEVFLNSLNDTWKSHTEQTQVLKTIFLYLDRKYVLESNMDSIWDMGLKLFHSKLMTSVSIRKKTIAGFLELIEKERLGGSIDSALLKSLVEMYSMLGIYELGIEQPFLEASHFFYKGKGIEIIESSTVPVYLRYIEAKLQEEISRVDRYLLPSTLNLIVKVVEDELLKTHAQRLLEDGFEKLLEDNKIEDLAILYKLMKRIEFLDKLACGFGAYVKNSGLKRINEIENDETLIQDLLALKDSLDNILAKSFESNDDLKKVINDSFESFINTRQNRPAELIAKFVDLKLRAGNKTASDDELELMLDKLLILFRYLHGKDVFEAFYKKDLARRLLLQKSASNDAEKYMLSRLKSECGPEFTSKLEGMFRDVELSDDLMASFNENTRYNIPLQLHVSVLNYACWPPCPETQIKLPKLFEKCQETFKNFYMEKYSKRKLEFKNTFGHCVVASHFPKGRKDLSVSVYQAAVLLLFNDHDMLTFKEIAEKTLLDKDELVRTMQSLSLGKARVLLKSTKGKDITTSDEFRYNFDFQHALVKIKINSIQLKEMAEENIITNEQIRSDRLYLVEAAATRIMKARKSMAHTELVEEVSQVLKFNVDPVDMKQKIESLIEREYIERDAGNPSVYNYVA